MIEFSKTNLKISVVIPVYNAAHTIERAVESVLCQSKPAHEIIIVDDASTDNSSLKIQEIIANYSTSTTTIIYLLQDKNYGPANARNKGWEVATGDIICFLDSDDCFISYKLEFITQNFKEDTDVLINHFTHESNINSAALPYMFKTINAYNIILSNCAQGSSISVRKNFNIKFPIFQYYCEDLEFALIATQYGKVVYTPQTLTFTNRPQLSKGGLSSNKWNMRKGEMRAFKSLSKTSIKWKIFYPVLISISLIKHFIKYITNAFK